VLAANGAFLIIDLTFFGANTLKLFEGGWFPLVLAAGVAFLMLTWRRGMRLMEAARVQSRMPEDEFLRRVEAKHLPRIPGTAAFLTLADEGMPLPLMNFVRHLRVLHERVLLVTIMSLDVPRASPTEHLEVVPITEDLTRVILRFGFMDPVHIPAALRQAVATGQVGDIDVAGLTYFISHETVVAADQQPGMAPWRAEIFALMQRNAEETATYFWVPAPEVMEVGIEVAI
jgi:KUP system potassium uptake protein